MMIPVIVRPDAGTDVEDVRRLAAQRSVPVEERSDLHYACVGFMQAPLTDAADSTRHNSGPRRTRNERKPTDDNAAIPDPPRRSRSEW